MSYDYGQVDFYKRKAREEKFPSRSVYKLQEIDKKYNLIKKGDRVLDLGCAPGSWFLYISRKIGDKGRVVGVDIDDLKIQLPTNALFLKKNITDLKTPEILENSKKYQVVVSDAAPGTSGINFLDVQQSLELCEQAFNLAREILEEGGNFLCKIFDGEGTEEFVKKLKFYFNFTKRFRPKATKKQSREIYIIAKEFSMLK